MLRKYLLLIFSVLIIFASCKEEQPDRGEVIQKIRNASELATVEYVVSKVISAQKKHFLSKNTYFFAETEATIKAGIDLSKLRPGDIDIKKDRINIELPAIELINFSYPAEGFKVIKKYTSNQALFRWNNFSVKEKDKLYRMGETDIRNNIDNLGITESARENTALFLRRILQKAGFNEIYIHFKDSETIRTN